MERFKTKMSGTYKYMLTLFIVHWISSYCNALAKKSGIQQCKVNLNKLQVTAPSNSTTVSNTSLKFHADIVTNQPNITFQWYLVDEKSRKPLQRICPIEVVNTQQCSNSLRMLQSECRVYFVDTIQTLSGPVRVRVTAIGTTMNIVGYASDPILFTTPWRIEIRTEKHLYKCSCVMEMTSFSSVVKWTLRSRNSNSSFLDIVPCCKSNNVTSRRGNSEYFVTDVECRQEGKVCDITIDSSAISKYAPINGAYIRCSHPHDDYIGSTYIVIDTVNALQGMQSHELKYIIFLGVSFGLIFILSCSCIFLVVLVMRSKRKALAEDKVVELASSASLHRLRNQGSRADET